MSAMNLQATRSSRFSDALPLQATSRVSSGNSRLGPQILHAPLNCQVPRLLSTPLVIQSLLQPSWPQDAFRSFIQGARVGRPTRCCKSLLFLLLHFCKTGTVEPPKAAKAATVRSQGSWMYSCLKVLMTFGSSAKRIEAATTRKWLLSWTSASRHDVVRIGLGAADSINVPQLSPSVDSKTSRLRSLGQDPMAVIDGNGQAT